MKNFSILLVDDDPVILLSVGKVLEKEGYDVQTAESGEEAIMLLNEKKYDLVMTDLIMGKIDGIHVLKKIKDDDQDTMVIILTGYGGMTSAIEALRLDADDYIMKPCEPEEIFFRVSGCLEKLEFKRKIKDYEKILPVCCICKKIREDSDKEPGSGEWVSVEDFLHNRTKLEITSGYCSECAKKLEKEFESR